VIGDRPRNIDRILAAKASIDPAFLDTPLVRQAALDRALGCSLIAKVETLNPIRSFKGRGAELFAATELRPGEPVVCASAGNFGQGLAYATVKRGHACTVYAATSANTIKVAAMRNLGAEVRLCGADFDAAKHCARLYARQTRQRLVEDGVEPAIAEGAGTIGLELAAAVSGIDVAIVPLGNGALLAGVGAALRFAAPGIKIVAVVAKAAPCMMLSLAAGRVIETETADTIADGVAVRVPIASSLAVLAGLFDEVVAVSESSILRGMRVIDEHFSLLVEPAGAIGVAALLEFPDRFAGTRVATIFCGGNLSADVRRQLAAPEEPL
jgi:threonine dehydratase